MQRAASIGSGLLVSLSGWVTLLAAALFWLDPYTVHGQAAGFAAGAAVSIVIFAHMQGVALTLLAYALAGTKFAKAGLIAVAAALFLMLPRAGWELHTAFDPRMVAPYHATSAVLAIALVLLILGSVLVGMACAFGTLPERLSLPITLTMTLFGTEAWLARAYTRGAVVAVLSFASVLTAIAAVGWLGIALLLAYAIVRWYRATPNILTHQVEKG